MRDTAEVPQSSHELCNVSATGEERLPAFAAGATAASSNAGSLSPNSVSIVIPIPVVPPHEEDCAVGNPWPFDRVAAYNTRANQKGQVTLARTHSRQRPHFPTECCISGLTQANLGSLDQHGIGASRPSVQYAR